MVTLTSVTTTDHGVINGPLISYRLKKCQQIIVLLKSTIQAKRFFVATFCCVNHTLFHMFESLTEPPLWLQLMLGLALAFKYASNQLIFKTGETS